MTLLHAHHPDDQIAHLVLNRPQELNTMNATFWRELGEALAGLQRAGQARALVISSTGRHFSAGMALDVFGAGGVLMDDSSPEGRSAMGLLIQDMQATFTQLEIAAHPGASPRSRAAASAARSTWSPPAACAMPPPTPSSASRRSTSAWSRMSAHCSACPS
jgi:hypothetical protein